MSLREHPAATTHSQAPGVDTLAKLCRAAALGDQEDDQNCLEVWVAALDIENSEMALKGLEIALKDLQRLSQHKLSWSFHQNAPRVSPTSKTAGGNSRRALFCSLEWAGNEPQHRVHQLAPMLDLPPNIQGWMLRSAMHKPWIANCPDVCSKLRCALENQKRQKEGNGRPETRANMPSIELGSPKEASFASCLLVTRCMVMANIRIKQ